MLARHKPVGITILGLALIRLACGQKCFERYRHELDVPVTDGAARQRQAMRLPVEAFA